MVTVQIVNQTTGKAGRLGRAAILAVVGAGAKRYAALRNNKKVLTIVWATPRLSQTLNQRYRAQNKPTNVLSFAATEADELGDIVICSSLAQKEARQMQIPPSRWLKYLLAHGLLHLLGFDHGTERTAQSMDKATEQLL